LRRKPDDVTKVDQSVILVMSFADLPTFYSCSFPLSSSHMYFLFVLELGCQNSLNTQRCSCLVQSVKNLDNSIVGIECCERKKSWTGAFWLHTLCFKLKPKTYCKFEFYVKKQVVHFRPEVYFENTTVLLKSFCCMH